MLDQSIYKYKAAEKESFQTWKERKCELCSSLTGNPVKLPETARPEEIIMGTGRIKARGNITRETRTTETGKQKVWVYEYADMTLAQYEEYAAEVAQLDTPLARQMQDNATAQLEAVAALYEEVMKTADNQRAIMEGIAEIYEQGENKV